MAVGLIICNRKTSSLRVKGFFSLYLIAVLLYVLNLFNLLS